MSFTESNTVEAYLYDLLSGPAKPVPTNVVQEPQATYGRSHKGLGWRRLASADFPPLRRFDRLAAGMGFPSHLLTSTLPRR